MTITPVPALPPAPTRNEEKSIFNAKAEAWSAALDGWTTAVNQLGSEVEVTANNTADSEAAALASEVSAAAWAANAAASASSALNSPGTNGTSTTSLTVGSGVKVFTTQSGKYWSKGQTVVAASSVTPTTQMIGVITDYTGTSLTISVSSFSGSGTLASWIISMAAGTGLAFASEAEAEAGVVADKVMSPLQTAQAIAMLSPHKSGSTQVGHTTLTAASVYVQTFNIPFFGGSVTLPDANTYDFGGPKFAINNIGQYDLIIRDSTGAAKGFVRPGTVSTAFLTDFGTAAGVWSFEGASVFGHTAMSPSYTGSSATMTGFAAIKLDSNKEMIIFTSSVGAKACVYDKSTGVWGLLSSINVVNILDLRAILIDSTRVLISCQIASSTTIENRVLSVSGTTITAGSAANVTVAASGSNAMELVDLGGTFIYRYASASNNAYYAYGMTVSGTTITSGSPVSTSTHAASGNYHQYHSCSFVIGSTLVMFANCSTDANIVVSCLTASGTTLTMGTPVTVTTSASGNIYKVELLSTGRLCMIYSNSGIICGRLITLTGTILSSTSEVQNASSSTTPATGGSNLSVQKISTNRVGFITYYTGGQGTIGVFIDTAGTLTTTPVVSVVTNQNFDHNTLRLGVSGNIGSFLLNYEGTYGVVVRANFSTNPPTSVEIVPITQGNAVTSIGIGYDYGPRSRFPYQNAVLNPGTGLRLRGSSGVMNCGDITNSANTVRLNPLPTRFVSDFPFKPTYAGYVESDSYEVVYSNSFTRFRKLETTT